MAQPIIRPATAADTGAILSLIRSLAEYEKLSHEVMATEEALTRTLFGSRPYAKALIAEMDGAIIGFALYFYNYSTFLAKPGIYIEDLYVQPAHRQHGIGMRFFREIAKIAAAQGCGRIEWAVLDWNEPAIEFYKKQGAKPMDEWTVYRLTETEIQELAEA